MRLSATTGMLLSRLGMEKTLEYLSNAGFDGVDFSYDLGDDYEGVGENYIEFAHKMKALLDKYGLDCVQAHAPYTLGENHKFDESEPLFKKVVRSIESASILGTKKIVVHTIDVSPSNDVCEVNYRYYKALQPYAEKFDMIISIENLFTWVPAQRMHVGRLSRPLEMNAFVKSLNSPHFAVCVDVGHASITGVEPEDYIANIDADLLKVLHVHDNDYFYDLHLLPFMGNLNFANITAQLKKKGYKGDLSYEVGGFIKKVPDDFLPTALKYSVDVGRYLISKIEE
ncbi:MAG: sugar phosphate isomerase/epimerase [Clostridia bacterium]|nr:sugar phosphate isomerase/epimerase [Clostridia bacterium]